MKIDFNYLNQTTNADKEVNTRENSAAAVRRTETGSGYQLDISGIVMDNAAYSLRQKQGHGKTLEECMQEIGQQDSVALLHNYLAVMSNSLSAEDLGKMMKDGIDPRSIPAEDAVTLMDKIKVTLIQSGVDIAGFTDTLDSETLESVTGSAGEAAAVETKLREKDLPVTQSNVEQVEEAMELAGEITELSEGAKKYMVENEMAPTIENAYFAQFSSGGGNAQPKGYFAVEGAGYYARKADVANWEQLEPQIRKIIDQAGLEVSDQTMDEAKWLIEKGVPLTSESLRLLDEINRIQFPLDREKCLDAVTDAVCVGRGAKEASLVFDKSILQRAQEILDSVNGITDRQVEDTVSSGRDLTIENLLKENKESGQSLKKSYDEAAAKRLLEETRLFMTTEANLKLLKSGYSIETAELSQLVEDLKALEQQYYRALVGKDTDLADEKIALYKETEGKTAAISSLPAAVLGKIKTTDTFTLDDIYVEGSRLKSEYEKASQSYEPLRTQVRRDLGDSIQKAFRNVDDILADMGIEKTPENQRAVRILGYNSMEITEENLEAVRTADQKVNGLLDKMTPGMTLKLIREGINPLSMDIDSLDSKIAEFSDTVEEQTEKYSEFLFKLEKNNQITSQEREAYIGMYRLFRQIENTDGAAIGSVVNQEAALSLKNLLSAVRTSKKAGMDISIQEDFGGVSAVSLNGASITEQIESGFREMNEFLSDQDAQKSYYEEVSREMQIAAQTEEGIIEELIRFDQPVTFDNVAAQNALMNARGSLYKNVFQKAEETGESDDLEEKLENLYESMEDAESTGQAYEKLADTSQQILSKVLDKTSSYVDVRQLQLLCKELSLAKSLSSEEKYEVPVETEDGYTSMRLTIRRGEGDGKVEASLETEQYGKIAAEFTVGEKYADGYLVGSSEDSTGLLDYVKAEMEVYFEGRGREIKSMTSSISNSLDLNRFEDKTRTEGKADTRELYRAAKQLVKTVHKYLMK